MKMQTYYNASAICISINTNLNIFDKILLAWLFSRWMTSHFLRSPMALDCRPRVTTFPGRKNISDMTLSSTLCSLLSSHKPSPRWLMITDQPNNDVMIMIRPGKRPMSSMCPTILTDSMGVVKLVIGKPWIVIFFIILSFESNDHKDDDDKLLRLTS